METSSTYHGWKKAGGWLLYLLVLFIASCFFIKRPAYNWDMLPYMGVVLLYGRSSIDTVHQQVYAITKEQVPADFYNRMTDASNVYRNSLATRADKFRSQLPFYVVKPLYTRLAWLFNKAGVRLYLATILPSVIGWCCTAVLMLYWIKQYYTMPYAFSASICIMFSPPLLNVAGLSSPDALSAFFLLSAVYCLIELKSFSVLLLILVLSICTRIDNMLPAIVFLSYYFYWSARQNPVAPKQMLLAMVTLLATYFFVAGNVRPFGWPVLFYPAFVKQLNTGYDTGTAFDMGKYIQLVKSQLMTGFYFSLLSLFLFLSIYFFRIAGGGLKRMEPEQVLVLLFILIIVLRFVLQPLIADRLYIPYYLALFVFIIKKTALPVAQRVV